MTWYYCTLCGPSRKCSICGATECSQELHAKSKSGECQGCVETMKSDKPPWNFKSIPPKTRGIKHLRKRDSRSRRDWRKWDHTYSNKKWKRSQGRWVINPNWIGNINYEF